MVMQQLTGGIYILADNGSGYVGRTNDFDRRMQEHTRSSKRKVEKVLALFHMEMDRNEQRLVEQFFMDLFRQANQPLTNTNNSIALNPSSTNSRGLRRIMDRLDFCD
jgi:predicted GIY-YIG superfamily endonuclease